MLVPNMSIYFFFKSDSKLYISSTVTPKNVNGLEIHKYFKDFMYGSADASYTIIVRTVQNFTKIIICSLSVLCSPRLFFPDLPKSLAKISQRPENRKDWSKYLLVLLLAPFLKER